jgi:hypothetical protein
MKMSLLASGDSSRSAYTNESEERNRFWRGSKEQLHLYINIFIQSKDKEDKKSNPHDFYSAG